MRLVGPREGEREMGFYCFGQASGVVVCANGYERTVGLEYTRRRWFGKEP